MCKPPTLGKKIEPPGDQPQWHAMTTDEAIAKMGLPKDIRQKGLTTAEAKQRLEQYGPNVMTEKEPRTLFQRIWTQLYNVLVGILVFVAVVSLIKGIISTGESRVTNFIEVGLITFVVT